MKNDSLQEFTAWFQAQPKIIRSQVAKTLGGALPRSQADGDIEPSERFLRWLNAVDADPKVRIGKALTIRSLMDFFVVRFVGNTEWWNARERLLETVDEGSESIERPEEAAAILASSLDQRDAWMEFSKSWLALCAGALSNEVLGKWWALEQWSPHEKDHQPE
jgi:hypothetical protein